MSFLENPIVISWVGAFITLITPFLFFRFQLPKKQISYNAYKNEPFIDIARFSDEFRDRVQVSLDMKPASDIRKVEITIWNTGNTPLSIDEYNGPIKLFFGNNAEIMEAQMLETRPTDIFIEASKCLGHDVNAVTIEPLHLYRRAAISFRVLLVQTPFTKDFRVFAPIKGMDEPVDFSKFKATSSSIARVALAISFIVFLLLSVYSILSFYISSASIKLFLLLWISIAALTYFIAFIICASLFYYFYFRRIRSLYKSFKYIIYRITYTIKYVMGIVNY